jgi:hypothetical protein
MHFRAAFSVAATVLACGLAHPSAAQFCCEYAAGCFDASGAGDPLCVEYQGTIIADAQCDYGTGNCAPTGPGGCSGSGPDPACDDGDPCTADLCVGGTCQNPPEDACGLTLEKSDGGLHWVTERTITYELTVRTGALGASVELRETVPVGTLAVSNSGWDCRPNFQQRSTCTYGPIDMGPGETRALDFPVLVIAVEPSFEIFNEATIPAYSLVATTVTKSAELEGDPCEDHDFYCAHWQDCIEVVYSRGIGGCMSKQVTDLSQCPARNRTRAVGSSPLGIDQLLLYRLRDRVFAGTPAGRRATDLYYEYSPALLLAGVRNFDVMTTAVIALETWAPVVQALVDGRGDEIKVTREQVMRFEAFLAAVRSVADPELLAALEREVMLVEPSSFARLSAAELLTRLERLSFEIPSAIDPFHCYRVKPTKNAPKFQSVAGVEVVDPGFSETVRFDVRKPRYLCAPADKSDEGIKDLATHLESYEIKAVKGEPKHTRQRGLKVATQLGMLTLDTVKPTHLMVPTAKDPATTPPAPVPGEHEVDHYACYAVKVSKGASKLAKRIGVTIGDQLTDPTRRYLVKKPTQLCVPVEKNGEAVKHPSDHLLCYQVKAAKSRCDVAAPANALGACAKETDCGGTRGQTLFCGKQTKHAPVRGLHTSNQFGAEALDAVKDDEICLPALRF